MVPNNTLVARSAALLLAASLASCASLPSDWGRGDVATATAARGRALPNGDSQSLSRQLLGAPLTADSAITLALIHNPAVRETTARLGFAAADVYDAARVSNPVFSFSRLTSNDPAAVSAQVGLGIAVSFTDLLLLPARSRFAEARFAAAKSEVGAATLALASEVEVAWYRAAGAGQMATLRARVADAAQASADLAQRYFDAGNISKRELAMEKSAAAQANLDRVAAEAESRNARSALNRLMGLPASQGSWALAEGLPAPYADEDALPALQSLALDRRLDVIAARQNADAIAKAYGLERRTRWLGPIEVGFSREKETDGSRLTGPTLSWQIPLFNWGSGRVARAKAELELAEAQETARELDASNEVEASYAALTAAKALAERYRTELIPQREAVVAQAGLELNFMLIGAFEALTVKQQEYEAYAGYLDSVRDYWIARSELTRAVGQRLPSSRNAPPATLDAQALTAPKSNGGHSMNHGAMGHDMSGMEGMDMKGMEGMDMSTPDPDKADAPAKSGHAGHGMAKPASGNKKANAKQDAPSMPGMDHSGHDMSGMEGMEMPTKEPATPATPEMPVKQKPDEDHKGHGS